MKNVIVTLLGLFCCQILFAQADIVSDTTFTTAYPVKLNSCRVLKDGRIACVGERTQGKDVKGFFLLVDPQNNHIEERIFGAFGRQGFTSLAQSDDDCLYLVGYKEVNSTAFGTQAWLMRLDENGKKMLSEQDFGGVGTDRFDKIVWLNNGTGIIAGRTAAQSEGNIWLHTINGITITPRPALGNGTIDNLVELLPTPDKDDIFWLCGNRKNGDYWFTQVSEQGVPVFADKKPKHKGSVSPLLHAAALLDNKLLLTGQIETKNGDNDVWWTTTSGINTEPNIQTIQGRESETPTAVCAIAPNKFWLSVATTTKSKGRGINTHSLRLFQSQKEEKTSVNSLPTNVNVQFLEKKNDGNYLVVGTANDGKSIRFTTFRYTESVVAAKSAPKLEFSDLRMEDKYSANPDGVLSPNERGVIKLKLKNTGDADMREGGQISVQEAQILRGVSIVTKTQYLPILTRGMEYSVSIAVKTSDILDAGNSKINIIVEEQGRQLLTIPFSIRSTSTSRATAGKEIHFQNPASGTREVRTQENTFKIKADVYSDNRVKTSTPTIYKTNVKLDDGKAKPIESKYVESSGRFTFSFETDLQLDTGRNVFYLKYEDTNSDSIVIYFEPEKPDLHILSIGVPYKDIKFTSKDARDFAQTVLGQKGNGFFNEVFVDTLLSERATETKQIERAFERLKNRFVKDNSDRRIKSKDYLIIFISSHGMIREDGRFALLPSDFEEESVVSSTIDYKDMLEKFIAPIDCKRFVFIDACHSGAGKRPTNSELSERLRLANLTTKGLVTFTSCSDKELSFEYKKGENGVFTAALLEVFKGKSVKMMDGSSLSADRDDGKKDDVITIKELTTFLTKRVPDLLHTENTILRQTPQCLLNNMPENMTLFIIK